MTIQTKSVLGTVAGLAFGLFGTTVFADSIDPLSYGGTLAVGESVTIEKTVIITEEVTDATIDAHFLIDTSGSMGGVIDDAKALGGALFAALEAEFGDDLAAGVGVFSEGAGLEGDPCFGGCFGTFTDPGTVINLDLSTDSAAVTAAVGDIALGVPDGGGDFPESSYTALELVAENLSWRDGSARFAFVLSDASSKGDLAAAKAALVAEGVTVVSLDYGGGALTTSMAALGPEVDVFSYAGTDGAAGIIADVTAGITASFAEYDAVTVSDLGGGLPSIGVSVVCTGADIGGCVGADAIGDYDRSEDRTFTFDVTFTGLEEGNSVFETYALVDRGIVAREIDDFTVAPVPLPATAWMMIAGLGGLGAMRRRRRKS